MWQPKPDASAFYIRYKSNPYLWRYPSCTAADALDCLRAVDVAFLQDINLGILNAGFFGTFQFAPVVDGSFIMRSPTDLLAEGTLNGDTLLSVTNSNEGTIFVNQNVEYDVVQYVRELFPLFGATESVVVASIYGSVGSRLDQVNTIVGESTFVCPTYRLLDVFPGKSYKGAYAILPALHADDVFYYFPSYTYPDSSLHFNNTMFRNTFSQGFLSFAAHLNPNAKLVPSITPAWQKWSDAQTEMVFNKTEGGAPLIMAAPSLL
ncbi:Alpha/Beta hydrolase protein [Mycena rosella]|uniref:Alpha/Beta hydrolase protein n=1 Tax=Mycena rosella TaxID=1033263 RepID=A0AAD7CYS3_MYCRO|nr:Alpha/Beta hydrolase protein [Mycena rosella]